MTFASTIGLLAALTFPETEPLDPNLDWYDCSESFALEGRGFPGQGLPYNRLPESQKARTSEKVWNLSKTSIGFNVRFKTDSDTLAVRWDFPRYDSPLPYMSVIAHVGIDIYARRPGEKEWRHVNGGVAPGWRLVKDTKKGEHIHAGELKWSWRPGDEAMIYLPMRFGPRNFAVGLKKGATFEKARPHIVDKPVVIYGTSICNGGAASRAGLAFPAIMGRLADVEVVNLGFSGAAKMELPMADLVAEIDASLYILDCEWNMSDAVCKANFEPFVRRFKELRPDTPVLVCGGCTELAEPRSSERITTAVLAKLRAEDPKKWANWSFLSGVDQLPKTDDCTHDHCHPNDLGYVFMGRVYAEKITSILAK